MFKVSLLYPMAAMVFGTWLLAILNLKTRGSAWKRGEVPSRYFKTFTQGEPTERVVVVGRHYDHQFQLPTWFLLTCATALAVNHVSALLVGLAWGFIAARLIHSAIHLGPNHPLKRAGAFALGWAVLCAMWLELLLGADLG